MGNSLTLLNSVLEEYANDIQERNKDVAFEYFVAENYFREIDLSLDEIKTGLVGGSQDWGLDGIYIFLDDNLINDIEEIDQVEGKKLDLLFFQFKNSSRADEGVIQNFNSIAPHIVNLSDELTVQGIHTEVKDKIILIQNIIKKIAKNHPQINFNFIHGFKGDKEFITGEKRTNESYLQRVTDLQKIIEKSQLGLIQFNYEIIDAAKIIELSRNVKSYSLKLKVHENPIYVEYGESGQKGYMSTVLLKDYFNFLVDSNTGKLRRNLFEANIRDFQNHTVVNKDIQNSIKHATDIDFWWLNNGVTIIADKGTLVGKEFHLDNIQIVNGLQTSYSIYNVYNEDQDLLEKDERSLFVKIILTEDKESRDKIIKSTNSQNPVAPSLLRATDSVQRNIEDYFLLKDYYYDRRKNYYRNLGKPRNKIIAINYLSQCIMTIIMDNPSKARSNPTILIKKNEDYNKLFPKSRDVHVYFNCMLIMKQTEEYLKKDTENAEEINVAIGKYYSFHVARIATSLFFNETKINEKSLRETDEINITDEHFSESVELLKVIIREFKEETQQHDLVNISKLGGFSNAIIAKLKEEFEHAKV